jgi:CRP/FNR family cyclic AMP-dependent transcriptional regulator
MRKSLYIFGLLSDEDVAWTAAIGTKVAIPDGAEVIVERARPGALFLLVRGQLRVTTGVPPRVLATIRPGEVLGEASFIDSRPASATVTAVGPAVVLRVDEQELRAKIDLDEGFAARFYRAMAVYLAQRLRATLIADHPAGGGLSPDVESADELSEAMMDDLAVAGKRVEWLLSRFDR